MCTVLIVAAVILVVAVLHFGFGLFTKYNYITGLLDSTRSHYQIVLVGEVSSQEAVHLPVAAKAFSFEYVFYGCVVSGPAMNGISDYNKVMADALTEVNGPGWEQQLLKTIKYLNQQE